MLFHSLALIEVWLVPHCIDFCKNYDGVEFVVDFANVENDPAVADVVDYDATDVDIVLGN